MKILLENWRKFVTEADNIDVEDEEEEGNAPANNKETDEIGQISEGECPEDGCIQKRDKGWVVISNKTGECWGRSKKDDGECTYYDSKEDAESALGAYHAGE